jgi:tryptophan synthase alpha chain
MQILENKSPTSIGLIGHIIVNYPNPKDAEAIIDILVKNKVDLIELQIPFSEPIADGPLFTRANHEAIKQGVTLADCYALMSRLTQQYPIPFVFMTYANILMNQGFHTFVKKAKGIGAKGAIVPDLPLDMATDYLKACLEYDFAAIPVVAPNISKQRLDNISQFFNGYIYALARSGVTGVKTHFEASIMTYINKLRTHSTLPISLGFGISSAEDITFLKGKVDYAVVGTETLRAYHQRGLRGVETLWQALAQALLD